MYHVMILPAAAASCALSIGTPPVGVPSDPSWYPAVLAPAAASNEPIRPPLPAGVCMADNGNVELSALTAIAGDVKDVVV